MKCLRCGYCCIQYAVVIIDVPELGYDENNAKFKPSGQRCQHLVGDEPGKFSCAIHNESRYTETPCYEFTQTEIHPDTPCRVGEYVLNGHTELVFTPKIFLGDSDEHVTS